MNSIYWYDYETFGIDPRFDRLAQFAGIRTDEALNIIGQPLTLYCKPADDMLPDPQACLITGITPQKADAEGCIEAEFIARIHAEFSQPGTCVSGFNNIRFDDEFTRHALYRNFFNPYAHEWQNGNSRWDIIDMVRLTRALRPDGIVWPEVDGKPSNRLELLTAANGIEHEAAHDAMSDVYATIAVARLIRSKQPRLYDYLYKLRKKNVVLQHIDLRRHTPLLHVSSRYAASRGALAVVMPLCMHPVNRNAVIVYDLAIDPAPLLACDSEEIRARLYTRRDELPEDVERIPLKQMHVNKCPVIAPLNTLDEATAERLQIDLAQCEAHRQQLLTTIDTVTTKVNAVFEQNDFPESDDVDAQLYSGGFFSRDDMARMDTLRATVPEQLAGLQLPFDDPRLPEMLFRYRARNFPHTLDETEHEAWNRYRRQKFTDPSLGPRTLNQVLAGIDELRAAPDRLGPELVILDEIEAWLQNVQASLR